MFRSRFDIFNIPIVTMVASYGTFLNGSTRKLFGAFLNNAMASGNQSLGS